ncbi:MAG: Hpt domain-containing protein [Bacteroidales bacterium]|nr:Hpt domain-containing protein [Bacteroidales bacterium]
MAFISKDQFIENFQYFDKEVVLEIINIFIDEYPERLQTLRKNIDDGDFDQLRFNAHSIKGVIANFVAPEVQNLAKELEMKGTNKETEGVNDLYDLFKEKADQMMDELKEIKKHYE